MSCNAGKLLKVNALYLQPRSPRHQASLMRVPAGTKRAAQLPSLLPRGPVFKPCASTPSAAGSPARPCTSHPSPRTLQSDNIPHHDQAIGHCLSAAAAALPDLPAAPSAGRLKQSFARWCYAKIPLDDLCRQAADMGCSGIDLIDAPDWPTARKYGLTPAMTQGEGKIPFGWNHKENHEALEKQLRVLIAQAADAKAAQRHHLLRQPQRHERRRRQSQLHRGLRRIKKFAEDTASPSAWSCSTARSTTRTIRPTTPPGAWRWCKGVDSPRVKLLYDIYHMQIMEGDIIRTIRDNIQYIGHFHTGGVPGRHELDDTQELQWRTIAKAIADLNFTGFFAHEFQPSERSRSRRCKQAVELCTV